MTNLQLYLVIAIPLLGNAVLIGLLMAYVNAKIDGLDGKLGGKIDGLRGEMNERFNGLRGEMNERFNGVAGQFAAINQRFDDMRDLWRAELRRVEEVLDARLGRLEERG